MSEIIGGRCSQSCANKATHEVSDGHGGWVHYRCESCALEEARHGWIIRAHSKAESHEHTD